MNRDGNILRTTLYMDRVCIPCYIKTREQIFIRLYLVAREYASVSVERGEKGTFSEGFARFFNRTRGRGAKRTATSRKTFSKDNRGGLKRRKGRKGGWRRKLANRVRPRLQCQLNVVYRVYCLVDEKYSLRIGWRLRH